ncbi:MAG: hypothetical protein WC492_01915 [Candidatus Micrarchaeia archaeon]
MKAFFVLAIFMALFFSFGCTSSKSVEPVYVPANNSQAQTTTPAQTTPAPNSTPTTPTPATTPIPTISEPEPTVPVQEPAPVQQTANNSVEQNVNPANTGASALSSCAGMTATDQAECVFKLAESQKDVSLCIYIQDKDWRHSCITRWCLSGSRDFSQCEKLSDYDDRLGCFNKCNPNPNT